MSTFGVQSTGFAVKRLADIVDSLKARLEAVQDGDGNTISVDPEDSSLLSQLTMIFAENLSEAWAMAGALANQFDPNYNVGAFQSGTVQLNGIFRRANIPTTINVSCTGTGGMTIPAGTVISYEDNEFLTDADIAVGATSAATGTITIGAQPANGTQLTIGGVTYTWTTGTLASAYSVKSEATLANCATHLAKAISLNGVAGTDYGAGTYAHPLVSGSANSTVVTVTARSTGSNGNTIAMASNTGNVTVSALLTGGTDFGTGTGTATSPATSPVVVPDGSSMAISTPVAGLQTATCTGTPVAGVAIESDEELRIRQQASTQLTAAREVEAILDAVNNVSGVTHAQIFENPTASPVTVNGVTVPAGSIYVVVVGGLDGDVADAIYSRLSCMTQTDGNTSKTYGTVTIKFERPIPVLMGVSIVAAQRGGSFPTDYDTQIQDAIVAWAESTKGYVPGQTVYANDLYEALLNFSWVAPRDALVGAPGFMYGYVQATGNFTISSNSVEGLSTPSDYAGLTVVVGAETYTFTDALDVPATPNMVSTWYGELSPKFASATSVARNLAKAINASPGGAGFYYGQGTTFNVDATAVASGNKVYLTAIPQGSAGNSVGLTGNAEMTRSASTLTGGGTTSASGGMKEFPISGNSVAVFDTTNIVVTRPLANGTITFTSNAANNDTVTVNGKVYTFQTSVTNTDGHVLVGGNKYMTATNLALAINLTGSTGTGAGNFNYAAATTINAYVSAVEDGGVVTVTDKTDAGASANSFTLAKSSTNITISGATLTGGEG